MTFIDLVKCINHEKYIAAWTTHNDETANKIHKIK